MSEKDKPGFLERLFGRKPTQAERPDTPSAPASAEPSHGHGSASRSEGQPNLTTAAAAGDLPPIEPVALSALAEISLEPEPPTELAGADLQPIEPPGLEGPVSLAPIEVPAEPSRAPVTPAAEPVQKNWWRRLTDGMRRTSSSLGESVTSLFTKKRLDHAMLEELEDALVRADLGVETATRIAAAVGQGRYDREIEPHEVRTILAAEVEKALAPVARPLAIDRATKPYVILMVGVNGAGKTTTIGKLAQKFRAQGLSVLMAAGDTFRAAAIEQLKVWGERTGATILAREPGGDAAGLAFDALAQARATGTDVLLIDTAGRLQNKTVLMAELEKIVRVLKKVDPDAPHATLLVLDATVGQNALSQVELFRQTAGVTGLVMTKLDGTARGGILVALAAKFGLPIHFIGVGEGVDDLAPFAARDFARAIAGLDEAA
jgi:fused signal recognition particle receptor